MTGYATIKKYEFVLHRLNQLGLTIAKPSFSMYDSDKFVAVVPMQGTVEEPVPIYSRDAELFVGSLEEVENWVDGVEWARQYDMILFGKKHNDNRKRKEQDVRNRNLVDTLKQ
jgi:hypothetical protein